MRPARAVLSSSPPPEPADAAPPADEPTARVSSPLRWIMLFLGVLVIFGPFYSFDNPAGTQQALRGYFNVPDSINASSSAADMALFEQFNTDYQLLYSLYSLPNTVLPLFGGALVDRLGVRFMVVICSLVALAGQCLVIVGVNGQSWAWMFVGRAAFGVGLESLCVAQRILVARWFIGKELALAMGAILALGRFGSVLNDNVSARYTAQHVLGAYCVGAMLCIVSLIATGGAVWLDGWFDAHQAALEAQRDASGMRASAEMVSSATWKVGAARRLQKVAAAAGGGRSGAPPQPSRCDHDHGLGDDSECSCALPSESATRARRLLADHDDEDGEELGAPVIVPGSVARGAGNVRDGDRAPLVTADATGSGARGARSIAPTSAVASSGGIGAPYPADGATMTAGTHGAHSYQRLPSDVSGATGTAELLATDGTCRCCTAAASGGGDAVDACSCKCHLGAATTIAAPSPPRPSTPLGRLRAALCSFSPAYWLLLAVCVAGFPPFTTFNGVGSALLTQRFTNAGSAHDQITVNAILGILYTVAAVIAPIAGAVVDRLQRRGGAMACALAMACLCHLLFATSGASAPALLALMGLAFATYASSFWSSISYVVPASHAGLAFGLMGAVQNTGLALAPLVVAMLQPPRCGGDFRCVSLFLSGMAGAGALAAAATQVVEARTRAQRGTPLPTLREAGVAAWQEAADTWIALRAWCTQRQLLRGRLGPRRPLSSEAPHAGSMMTSSAQGWAPAFNDGETGRLQSIRVAAASVGGRSRKGSATHRSP